MSNRDERIVQMQFDNRQFENGVQTSIKSLDKLKNGLKLDESARSLSNLERAGKSFSLAGIASGVDAISNKFNALGIVGFTVLQNITNSALNFGKRIVSALTIDPIKTGLQEYETKMGAIQTILTNTASKGSTLEDVNKALNELNEYSDKTIYNFSEMARNIGTFTAAGIGLKESATAIKGIANLAAGSGSSAMQASTAMYQLSQAIAGGAVRLMDWNSVVNAGMGGELFQNALKKTAKSMGIVVDASIPFRESLEKGWLTSEVLTRTLATFADDPALVKAATEVKTFTQLFDTMKESVQSGWAISWENIIGTKDEAAATLTKLNNAFGAIVGSTAASRNGVLKFWKANGGRATMIDAITHAFTGLQSILKPIGEAFRQVFPAMTGSRLVEISKGIRDLAEKFKIGDENAAKLRNTFKGLFSILDMGINILVAIGKGIGSLLGHLAPAGDGLLSFTSSVGLFLSGLDKTLKTSGTFSNAIGKIGDLLGESFSSISNALKTAAPGLYYGLADIIGGAFDSMRTRIMNVFRNGGSNSVFDVINGGLFATILLGVRKFIDTLTKVADNGGGFLNNITGILDGVKGSLTAYQSQLKAGTLLAIAISIGILAASLVSIASIDSAKLTTSLAAMTAMFVELFGSMAIFEKIMGSAGFVSMGRITLSMMGLSISILILSSAMTKLAKLDWDGIARGLTGVGVLMAELALFMKMTDLSGMGVTKGIGLLILAASIDVLATAVRKFSEIDTKVLKSGLLGVAAVLAEIAIFVNLTGNATRVITTAIGLTILGAAMLIFAKAINAMGIMPGEQIARGLLAMAGALTIITIALELMPKNIIFTSLGLVVVAEALVILSNALTTMGGLSWENIAKSLVVLAGSLTIIATAMMFMKSALPGATALLIVAAALAILTPALKALGAMSLVEIGTGLLVLAGVFAVIGVAGLVLAPLTPIILALSAAIALFGVGCIAVGAGLLLFSAGLAALALSGTAGAAAIVGIIKSIIELIPSLLKTAAVGLIEFAKVIGDGAPVIADATIKMVKAMIKALLIITPDVLAAISKLITVILKTIVACFPEVLDAGIKLIIAFLKGISNTIGQVIQAGLDLMISFINGLAEGIRKNTSTMILAIQNLMSAIIDAGSKVLVASIKGFFDIGTNIVAGLIKGIESMISAVARTAGNLGQSVINSAKEALGIHSPSRIFDEEIGRMVPAGMAKGIKDNSKVAVAASTKMSKDVVAASKKAFQEAVQQIDDRKYYNQLSLAQELEAWEKLQTRYKVGSEERKKADREVYRVQQEINTANEAYTQKALDIQTEFTDKRKQLEDDYYTKTKEINDKLTQDIQSVTQAYDDAVNSRTQALYSAYALFDKVSEKDPMSGDELIKNLRDQVTEFDSWQKSINELAKKGIDEGLLKELREMGPQAGTEIDALNTLSTDKLTTYVTLWKTKHNEARTQALSELEGMRLDTITKINQLKVDSTTELDKYRAMWLSQMLVLTTESSTQLTKLKAEWLAKIGTLRTDTEKEFTTLTQNVGTIITSVDWAALGGSIIEGMAAGIRENAADLAREAADAARAALDAASEELDINSPSKEFAKLGMYSMQGFANGFRDYAGVVVSASKDVAASAISGLKDAISRISEIVNGDIDVSPIIRPVLDLSNVEAGGKKITDMFSQSRGISLASVANKLPTIGQAINGGTTGQQTTQTTPGNITFQQNNYSPKPLSRIDIYRQTKNQISAMKGLVRPI